jgi:hypothetical protein
MVDLKTIRSPRAFYCAHKSPAEFHLGVTLPKKVLGIEYSSRIQTKGEIKSPSMILPQGAFQKPEGSL